MKTKYFLRVAILCCCIVAFSAASLPGLAQTPDGIKHFLPALFQEPAQPAWIGPEGGSVEALAADPNNPNILYAGSYGGGVYKTVDQGEHWFFAGNGITDPAIDSLAVDPVNSSIVYAGTHGTGIFKTTNGGASWFPVNTGIQANAVVYTLAVNHGNHNIVYAGTRGRVQTNAPPWNGIVYKTTNGGETWVPVLENIGGSGQEDWVYSVRVNPSRPNIVLAASHEYGLFLSDTYGGRGEWRSVGNVDGSGRAVDFDPRSWTNTAYYGTWHRTGMYRSTNNGYDWVLSSDGLDEAKIFPNGIAIAPANPSRVYIASFADPMHGVMRSDDSGRSWQRAGLNDFYVYGVAVPAGQQNVVLAGLAGRNGIYKTLNGGGSWVKRVRGLHHVSATGLAFVPPSTLYASTTDRGVMRSTDGGQSWTEWNSGIGDLRITGLVQSPANPNLIFALTVSAGLRRLNTAGDGWVASGEFPRGDGPALAPAWMGAEIPDQELVEEMLGYVPEAFQQAAGISAPVLSLAFAPSNPAIVYAGTDGAGLYASADGGVNWTLMAWERRKVQAVVVHPTDPNRIYIAMDGTGYFLGSPDRGQHWWFGVNVPEGAAIQALAISPADAEAVYVGTTRGVWRFANPDWTPVGLADQNVLSLAYTPGDARQIIAGTQTGAYALQRSGGWGLVHPEIAGHTVAKIAFQADAPWTVYLTTTWRGILRAPTP